MWSLAMCIDLAPAGEYKKSNHRPSVRVVRIPTAPTAITRGEKKAPQNATHFQAIFKRAVLSRAVGNGSWRSVNHA